MAKLLSPGKAATSPSLAIGKRVVFFQDVSWEVFSPAPHRTASLAGERRAPRLSQSPSQVHWWLGPLMVAAGTGGGALVALLPPPSGVTASLAALPAVPHATRD